MSTNNAASSSKTMRPTWDKDEWAAKAKAKDEHFADQAKAAEAAMKQGKKYKFHEKDADEKKPSEMENMRQRTEDVGIDKNLNKTMLVTTSTSGKGPRGPGFYCDLCDQTLKDSLSYLDHLNGRFHLRKLGQNTFQTRSTLSQVRAKIANLRAQTADKVSSQNYDFQKRLAAVREIEQTEKEKSKEDRKRKREERRQGEVLNKMGLEIGVSEKDVIRRQEELEGIEAMMGFGGFGAGKRKK